MILVQLRMGVFWSKSSCWSAPEFKQAFWRFPLHGVQNKRMHAEQTGRQVKFLYLHRLISIFLFSFCLPCDWEFSFFLVLRQEKALTWPRFLVLRLYFLFSSFLLCAFSTSMHGREQPFSSNEVMNQRVMVNIAVNRTEVVVLSISLAATHERPL